MSVVIVPSDSILAIDPGTEESGWAILDRGDIVGHGVDRNTALIAKIWSGTIPIGRVAIEMIASYGMPVGREVFETCVWIGKFLAAWGDDETVRKVYRRDVKLHLCDSPRAKDPNVRQAIIDRYPPTGGGKVKQIGTKAQPGPLYGVKSHIWAALGVALTAQEKWDELERF